MGNSTIFNAASRPLGTDTGTLPDVGGALRDLFQPLVFIITMKVVINYQVKEVPTPVPFRGVIQPLSNQDLFIKPEGQRSWYWLQLHAEPTLALTTDQVVSYLGKPTRIMAVKDYTNYGYIEYHLVQDWTGAGP